jgi:hypothetical protein
MKKSLKQLKHTLIMKKKFNLLNDYKMIKKNAFYLTTRKVMEEKNILLDVVSPRALKLIHFSFLFSTHLICMCAFLGRWWIFLRYPMIYFYFFVVAGCVERIFGMLVNGDVWGLIKYFRGFKEAIQQFTWPIESS